MPAQLDKARIERLANMTNGAPLYGAVCFNLYNCHILLFTRLSPLVAGMSGEGH
jgi:hypothetical protein